MKQPCASTLSPTHSPDRVEVFTGSGEPRVMCGYHASIEYPPAYTGGDRRVAQSPDYTPVAGSYQRPDRRRRQEPVSVWADTDHR